MSYSKNLFLLQLILTTTLSTSKMITPLEPPLYLSLSQATLPEMVRSLLYSDLVSCYQVQSNIKATPYRSTGFYQKHSLCQTRYYLKRMEQQFYRFDK